ncbi:MAG: DUF4019 domain-containing protein [Deltaproteobacteria bacterium]|nr:DUF4019 domain-containing protein [Deltaproteobacteria bacterium]
MARIIGRVVAISVLVFLTTCLSAFAASPNGKRVAALAAAESWLKLVDEGDYAGSWQQAAEYLRGAITEDQWVQSLQGVRSPLGKVLARKVKDMTHHTSLPGAPDGEYVVIQFSTSYQHKAAALETVTCLLDQAAWRVAGYYIK